MLVHDQFEVRYNGVVYEIRGSEELFAFLHILLRNAHTDPFSVQVERTFIG